MNFKGNNDLQNTVKFDVKTERPMAPREILTRVHRALSEKGYNPTNQIVGYILSGDPTYITSHQNARALICKIERDDLLQEMIKKYLDL